MRNCLILGSGRSGTSMLAGSLAASGYFMGEHLITANESNPKGFFEDALLNELNEDILEPLFPRRPPILGRWLFKDIPQRRHFWLSRLPVEVDVGPRPDLEPRIRAFVDREPYCFKDPRFCYTLPAWRPHLRNTAFVCVFREPARTAESVQRDCAQHRYLASLAMDFERAVKGWELMYRHILEKHRQHGEWLFVHFEQVLAGTCLGRLGEFLDAPVDRSFPEARYRRSRSSAPVPAGARRVYEELCEMAGYHAPSPSVGGRT